MDPVRLRVFIALGLLLNDVAAMDDADLDEDWARAVLVSTPVEFFR